MIKSSKGKSDAYNDISLNITIFLSLIGSPQQVGKAYQTITGKEPPKTKKDLFAAVTSLIVNNDLNQEKILCHVPNGSGIATPKKERTTIPFDDSIYTPPHEIYNSTKGLNLEKIKTWSLKIISENQPKRFTFGKASSSKNYKDAVKNRWNTTYRDMGYHKMVALYGEVQPRRFQKKQIQRYKDIETELHDLYEQKKNYHNRSKEGGEATPERHETLYTVVYMALQLEDNDPATRRLVL